MTPEFDGLPEAPEEQDGPTLWNVSAAIGEAVKELQRAQGKHPAMASAHEGYAVILEELDELWEEVKMRQPDRERMRIEAIQVAAMAMRFAIDVCPQKPVA